MNMNWLVAAWGRIVANCSRISIKIFLELDPWQMFADPRPTQRSYFQNFATPVRYVNIIFVAVWQPFVILLS